MTHPAIIRQHVQDLQAELEARLAALPGVDVAARYEGMRYSTITGSGHTAPRAEDHLGQTAYILSALTALANAVEELSDRVPEGARDPAPERFREQPLPEPPKRKRASKK